MNLPLQLISELLTSRVAEGHPARVREVLLVFEAAGVVIAELEEARAMLPELARVLSSRVLGCGDIKLTAARGSHRASRSRGPVIASRRSDGTTSSNGFLISHVLLCSSHFTVWCKNYLMTQPTRQIVLKAEITGRFSFKKLNFKF